MPADTATPAWPVISIADANAALAGPGSPLELVDGEVNGVKMKLYANAPPTIRSILEMAAATWPERDFIVYEDERVTYKAMMLAVQNFAAVLRDTYGVKKGDRVGVIMRNYPQWPVAFFAASALGAIATPMNSWWTGEELEYGLSFAGVKVAVVDGQIFERLRDHLKDLSELEHVIIARDKGEEHNDPRVASMEQYIGEANSWASLKDVGLPNVELLPDDDATIMYTSGTTGKPKGALASHRAVISNIFNSSTCQARMLLRRGEAIPEPDPNEQGGTLLAIPSSNVKRSRLLAGSRRLPGSCWNIRTGINMTCLQSRRFPMAARRLRPNSCRRSRSGSLMQRPGMAGA